MKSIKIDDIVKVYGRAGLVVETSYRDNVLKSLQVKFSNEHVGMFYPDEIELIQSFEWPLTFNHEWKPMALSADHVFIRDNLPLSSTEKELIQLNEKAIERLKNGTSTA